MNKYPYIGKGTESGSIVLFHEQNKGVTLESKTWASKNLEFHTCIDEDYFKNITAEHLASTYGKVESKEHAEFIKLLADVNNIRVAGGWIKGKFFCFGSDCENKPFLSFYPERLAKSDNEKLITIPLPPKEPEIKTPLDFCVVADEEPEPKEWPQVGDEVLTASNVKAIVLGFHEDLVWVKYTKGNCGYNTVSIARLKKPLTSKDELDAKLYDFFQCNSEEDLAEAIINGEIEGLEYKPQ